MIGERAARLGDYMLGVAGRGELLNHEQICIVARELLALSSAIDELENYKLAQFITGLADIMKETDHGR